MLEYRLAAKYRRSMTKQWEYTWLSALDDSELYLEDLNKLGVEGWEAVGLLPLGHAGDLAPRRFLVLMKRPRQ